MQKKKKKTLTNKQTNKDKTKNGNLYLVLQFL